MVIAAATIRLRGNSQGSSTIVFKNRLLKEKYFLNKKKLQALNNVIYHKIYNFYRTQKRELIL